MDITVSKLLILASVLCFVLAVFNVDIDSRDLVAAGLAFLAASFLV
jgi:hypothetical protein